MKLATKSPRRAEHRDPRGEYARYQAIFAQAAVGIAYTSLEGRITEANAAYCDMLGYAPAEIAGKTTRELTAADDRDVHDALREQLIRGERTHFAVEKRYLRRDGTVIWVHRTVTIARDAANEQPFLIQVVHDISERKRAEQQLERLRRARDVTSACRRVLAHVSDEAGLLSEVCRIAVDLGGYQQAWIGLAGGDEKCPITLAAHAGYRAGMPLPMTSPAVFTADGRYKGKMVRVLARGEPAIERDIVAEAPDEQMRERAVRHGWRSSLTVPLLSDGRALGGFEFNARETDAFDNDEITLLSELACEARPSCKRASTSGDFGRPSTRPLSASFIPRLMGAICRPTAVSARWLATKRTN
jgi:PAS domain S-box-containing protein